MAFDFKSFNAYEDKFIGDLDNIARDIDHENGYVALEKQLPKTYQDYLTDLEKPLRIASGRVFSPPPGVIMGRRTSSPGIDIDWSKWEFCLEKEKNPTPDDPGPKIILRPRSPGLKKPRKQQRRYKFLPSLVGCDSSTAVTSLSRPQSFDPVDDRRFIPVDKLKTTQTDVQYPYSPRNMNSPALSRTGSPNKYDVADPPGDYYHYMVPQNGYAVDSRILTRRQADPPKIRCGRVGSSWRHVTQCLGNLGNQIMFIDGAVKEDDLNRFPPWGLGLQPKRPDSRQQFYYEPAMMYNTMNGLPKQRQAHHYSYKNEFNDRARKGHKYWFDEKKPSSRLGSIRGSKGSVVSDHRSVSRQTNRTTKDDNTR